MIPKYLAIPRRIQPDCIRVDKFPGPNARLSAQKAAEQVFFHTHSSDIPLTLYAEEESLSQFVRAVVSQWPSPNITLPPLQNLSNLSAQMHKKVFTLLERLLHHQVVHSDTFESAKLGALSKEHSHLAGYIWLRNGHKLNVACKSRPRWIITKGLRAVNFSVYLCDFMLIKILTRLMYKMFFIFYTTQRTRRVCPINQSQRSIGAPIKRLFVL